MELQSTEIVDSVLDARKMLVFHPKVLLIPDVGIRNNCGAHTPNRQGRTLSDKHIGRIIGCQRQAAGKTDTQMSGR